MAAPAYPVMQHGYIGQAVCMRGCQLVDPLGAKAIGCSTDGQIDQEVAMHRGPSGGSSWRLGSDAGQISRQIRRWPCTGTHPVDSLGGRADGWLEGAALQLSLLLLPLGLRVLVRVALLPLHAA